MIAEAFQSQEVQITEIRIIEVFWRFSRHLKILFEIARSSNDTSSNYTELTVFVSNDELSVQ